MRRAAKWLGWIVAGIVGIPLLLLAFVFVAANTGVGRARSRADAAADRRHGPHRRPVGPLPRRVAGCHVELRDPDGDYTTSPDWRSTGRRFSCCMGASSSTGWPRKLSTCCACRRAVLGWQHRLPVPVVCARWRSPGWTSGGRGRDRCRRRRVRVRRGQQPDGFPCCAGRPSARRIWSVHAGSDQ